jgi:hypothetical protein
MADKPVSVLDLLAAMKIEVTDEKVASAKLDYVLFPKEKNDSGTFATTFGVDLRGSTLLLLSRARKSGILFESAVLKEHCAFFRNMLSSDFLEGTAYRSRKRARTSRSEPASGTHAESASSIFERSVVTLCDVAQYKVSKHRQRTDRALLTAPGAQYTGKLRQKMPIWDMVPLLRATDYVRFLPAGGTRTSQLTSFWQYDIKDLGGAALADWKLLQGLSSDQMARAISMVLDRTICGEHLLLQELSKYLYALETTTAVRLQTMHFTSLLSLTPLTSLSKRRVFRIFYENHGPSRTSTIFSHARSFWSHCSPRTRMPPQSRRGSMKHGQPRARMMCSSSTRRSRR